MFSVSLLPSTITDGSQLSFSIEPTSALSGAHNVRWYIVGFGINPASAGTFSQQSNILAFSDGDTVAKSVSISVNHSRPADDVYFALSVVRDVPDGVDDVIVDTHIIKITPDTSESTQMAVSSLASSTQSDQIAIGYSLQFPTVSGGSGDDTFIITRHQRADLTISDTLGANLIKFDLGLIVTEVSQTLVQGEGGLLIASGLNLKLQSGAVLTISFPASFEYQIGDGITISYAELYSELTTSGFQSGTSGALTESYVVPYSPDIKVASVSTTSGFDVSNLANTALEGTGYSFNVIPQGTLDSNVTIKWEVLGTGRLPTNKNDFTSYSGQVNFTSGEASARTISIPIRDDVFREYDKSFYLNLYKVVDGVEEPIIENHFVTIKSDDVTVPNFHETHIEATLFDDEFILGSSYHYKTITGAKGDDLFIVTRHLISDITINDAIGSNIIKFDLGVKIVAVEEQSLTLYGGIHYIIKSDITLDTGAKVTLAAPLSYDYQLGDNLVTSYADFYAEITSGGFVSGTSGALATHYTVDFDLNITSADIVSFNEGSVFVADTTAVYSATSNLSGVTYALKSGGDAALFEINANSGIVTFKANRTLDYESATQKTSYSFSITAKSAALSNEKTVTVNVVNLNDVAPTITSSATASSLTENAALSTADIIYTATGTYDVTPISWSLKGADAGLFDIDSMGQVTFKAIHTPDHETKSSYQFTVVATSGTLPPVEKNVTVPVTDLNEPPTITSSAQGSNLTDGSALSTSTQIYKATGNHDTLPIQWSLKQNNNDNASLFRISSTGIVTFLVATTIDYEAFQEGFKFTIIATSGAHTVERNVTIGITNVNDVAPDITSTATGTDIEEDVQISSSTQLYKATANYDLTPVTWSLASGADASSFDIDSTTGAVTFKNNTTANYETKASYSFTVVATSGDLSSQLAVTLNVDNVNQSLVGTENDDTIVGGKKSNDIRGLGGNDMITGGSGADTIDGGDGIDTVSYILSDTAVEIRLYIVEDGYSVGVGGHAQGDKLKNIENIIGSNHNDKLYGSYGENTIWGRGGNDLIYGSRADDILYGEDGDDTLRGEKGNDKLYGGAGDDILRSDNGNDMLEGGEGADEIIGGDGDDTASYATSNASVTVDLSGNQDSEGFITGEGGHAQGDKIKEMEHIIGSAYDDTLTGDGSDNNINGGSGNDIINGGAGVDTIDGGDGNDTADYSTSTASVTINLQSSKDQDGYYTGSGGHAQGDKLKNIENFIGSNYDDDLRGTYLANVIDGGSGDDYLRGYKGDDTLRGGAGDDELAGDQGDDRLEGGAGNDILAGANDDDWLDGSDGVDKLYGGSGNDRLIGGAGADTLDGSDGWDSADYSGSDAGVTIDLSGTKDSDGYITATGGHAQGDRLKSIEEIIGSDHNDNLTGTNGQNQLMGGDGNDIITGGAGADDIDGGSGVDTVSYAGSNAKISVHLDKSADVNGTIVTASGGHAEGDDLTNIENLVGSVHNDRLRGDQYDNRLEGGDGNDTLEGRDGNDTLAGGDNDDALYGDLGNDVLLGGNGYDRIFGGAGNDLIEGGATNDRMEGGAGIDTLSYENSNAAVTVNLSSSTIDEYGSLTYGTASGGHAHNDLFKEFENLIGSAYADTFGGDDADNRLDGRGGNDSIRGGGGNDIIIGGNGNDSLYGDGGNDTLIGGAGSDKLAGDAGWDIADYSGSNTGVTIDLSGTKDGDGYITATGGHAQGDRLKNIEEIIGSDHTDTITGDGNNNIIHTGKGADVIDAGAGDDTVVTSFGHLKLLNGGDGNDTLSLDGLGPAFDDNGNQRFTWNIVYLFETGLNKLYIYHNGGASSGSDTVNFTNFEVIKGSQGGDIFYGSGQSDVLHGGDGSDYISGGRGADTLDGGAGSDTVSYKSSSQAVQIDLSAEKDADGYHTGTGGDAQGDKFKNFERVEGSNYDDVLIGNDEDNTLEGWLGNDRIVGGLGADTLDGDQGDADILDYSGSNAAIRIDFSTTSFGGYSAGYGGHAEGDKVIDFEIIRGSDFDDWLKAGSNGLTFEAGKGNDYLVGGLGADTIDGGAGFNTLSYDSSNSAILVRLSDTKDANGYITGVGGHAQGDKIKNIQKIIGSNHEDLLYGDDNDNVFIGGAGLDAIDGMGGNNTASYEGSDAGVTIDLSSAKDVDGFIRTSGGHASNERLKNIQNLIGSDHVDTLTGDDANNIIEAGAGNDTVVGGAGNDTIIAGEGADTVDGGTGVDVITYDGSNAGVIVNLSDTKDANGYITATGGYAAGDKLKDIENIIGSAFADKLRGDNNSNLLQAGAGNDEIEGGGGIDTIDGGDGNDIVSYKHSSSNVTVNLAATKDASGYISALGGDAQRDKIKNIENIEGSRFADTLTGDGGSNIIIGAGGADIIDGGAGIDTASYASSTSGIVVHLGGIKDSNGFITAAGGDAHGDKLKNIENIIGSNFNDTLTGDDGNNTLTAGLGNDNVNGGAGNDRLIAGIDNLTADGGAGTDTLSYYGYSTGITIDLNGTANATGYISLNTGDSYSHAFKNIENFIGTDHIDIISGNDGANILRGHAGNDRIYGFGGNDMLVGDDGDDQLYAGAGTDILIGGRGNDRIELGAGTDHVIVVFNSDANDAGQWELTDGNDTIVNFKRAEDTLFFSDETQKTGVTPITMVTGFAGDEDAPIIKAQIETSAGKKYISQLTFTFALNDGVTTVNFDATNRYEVTDESLFNADSTLTDYTMLQTIFGGENYFCMKDYDALQTSLDVI